MKRRTLKAIGSNLGKINAEGKLCRLAREVPKRDVIGK
jgi:hypothetical protein